ncbi:MAG: hypothetical protein JWO31_604 [Phycisphaerales bacterium]|nr:hypothetical protein [Phycisphaerales bacterium]
MSHRPSMQRPVMDPLFLQDVPPEADSPARQRRQRWVRGAARGLRWTARALLSSPLARRSATPAADGADPSTARPAGRASRAVRAVGYRLVFAPALVALVASTLVFSGTHPPAAAAAAESAPSDVYHDPVAFPAEDGVWLGGWIVPVVDARRVMLHKDRLLRQRHPAVVLVHDFGRSPTQVLPLVGPLHDDGIVVLSVGLRGTGTPAPAAQTFGLNEALDVRAAVDLLRGHPFVDPTRIAVVGLGTGANAASLAAGRDAGIVAVVLADPVTDADAVVAARLGPDQFGLRWLQPAAKWAFEIGFQQHLDDASPDQHVAALAGRKVLRLTAATSADGLPTAATVGKVRAFCRDTLRPWEGK